MSLPTLIWLFPIAFMLHDFEELIGFEPWLKRHGSDVRAKLQKVLPTALMPRVGALLGKSTTEFAVPVCLIFLLTAISSFIAVELHSYAFFLAASAAFTLHGLMHIGQSIAMHRYVPALATSILIVLPYGVLLYPRLVAEGIVTWPGLLLYGLIGIVAILPIILGMHWLGDKCTGTARRAHTKGLNK
jgi:hypothetical protein